MADKKDDRICFRPGEVRLYKIAKYKESHVNKKGKAPTNTEVMLMALDMLLEREDLGEIREMEDVLIKLILGVNRNDCSGDQEYFNRLKNKINEFKNLLNGQR